MVLQTAKKEEFSAHSFDNRNKGTILRNRPWLGWANEAQREMESDVRISDRKGSRSGNRVDSRGGRNRGIIEVESGG